MIFEPDFETMPRSEMRRLQSQRLAEVVEYADQRQPFYKREFEAAGVTPHDIRSVDDITLLPITHKQDLRDNYPFGLFAVPRRELNRIHASSGTTGKPTVVGYTKDDLDVFARVNARCLAMAGAEPGMMLHNAYGYGLFTGGLGLHFGGELLGMSVVPVSGGMTDRQIMLINDFRPEVISCTPSYALTLAAEFARRGIGPEEISLKIGLHGAEPWTEGMRSEIDAGLGLKATNIFGLSEIIGPGMSNECAEVRQGSHINEDHFFPEVVDPDTGEPLAEGHEGVLLFTTLTKQALPLIRYWTGDLASLDSEECACGRTLVRMSLVKGRTDDMLIIRGVNLYPTEVALVLARFEELSVHHRLVLTREGTLDELAVEVEVRDDIFRGMGAGTLADEALEADETLQDLRSSVAARIKEILGVSARVVLRPPGSVPRSEGGKLARVDDRRRLD
jgi:phenylacetate-CoA ligase